MPKSIKAGYHYFLALLGTLIYGFPSEKIRVIGLTGTKGKSTALELLNAMLTEAGIKTALLSSVRVKTREESRPSSYANTMPGRGAIQGFLKEAVRAGSEVALLEVTSEGVAQDRHRFISWDGAVFLNIHPEHVEAHGSFERYLEAKLDFFRSLKDSSKKEKYFFINRSAARAADFIKAAEEVPGGRIIFFDRRDQNPTLKALKKEKNPDWLRADFNYENAAAAAAVAKAFGAKEKDIKNALYNFQGLRGRMDFVKKKPFAVVVDYAHTPDSLRAVYKTLKNKARRRLICVFGSAGGGRDKWKRPELGVIAAEHCDKIILTSEDPYNEDPVEIICQIYAGIPKGKNSKVLKITDRREALKEAIKSVKSGDIVIATGMGSQEWFYGSRGSKISWDEHKIVEEILQEMK